mmetsp:Transcript_37105/g.89942  ORF Transcript_37105/g.89942 Transcript_37105/m.89942 type:complete len:522 (+) Transcript_37105:65-1630(+)
MKVVKKTRRSTYYYNLTRILSSLRRSLSAAVVVLTIPAASVVAVGIASSSSTLFFVSETFPSVVEAFRPNNIAARHHRGRQRQRRRGRGRGRGRLSTLPQQRWALHTINSGFDDVDDKEDDEDEGVLPDVIDYDDDYEQRNLRFGGLGRLYSDYSTKAIKNNKVDIQGEESTEDRSGIKEARPSPPPHIEIVDRLSRSVVAVVGLGGVGSWAAEALCRSGVGHLVLVDLDDICISNTNRQLHTTTNSVGTFKIDEMERRLKSINPDVQVTLVHDFVSPTNVDEILLFQTSDNIDGEQQEEELKLTACLDAIDGHRQKSTLIASCARNGIPVVTCGGSAGRTDPTRLVVEDITRVLTDPLISSCRRILRRQYGFEQGISTKTKAKSRPRKNPRKWNIPCVVSKEPQRQVSDNDKEEEENGGSSSSLRRCDGALGTASFVTGTAGFIAAGLIVDMIAKDRLVVPRRPRNVDIRNGANTSIPMDPLDSSSSSSSSSSLESFLVEEPVLISSNYTTISSPGGGGR